MDDGDEMRRQFDSRGKKRLGLMFMHPLGTQRYVRNKKYFAGFFHPSHTEIKGRERRERRREERGKKQSLSAAQEFHVSKV